MNLEIFSIKDMAADAYQSPFVVQTTEVALRSFREAVQNPESPFHKHPQDYALYHIGTFDQKRGVITPCDPYKLVDATSLLMDNTQLRAVNDA